MRHKFKTLLITTKSLRDFESRAQQIFLITKKTKQIMKTAHVVKEN